MSIFVCDKCRCVDNTATSDYWALTNEYLYKDYTFQDSLKEYMGKPLCSECAKIIFDNTGNNGKVVDGKWHNRFEKKLASNEQIKLISYKGIIKDY